MFDQLLSLFNLFLDPLPKFGLNLSDSVESVSLFICPFS